MKNNIKMYSNKVVFGDNFIKRVALDIDTKIKSGELEFSIDVDNKKINIMEDIAASFDNFDNSTVSSLVSVIFKRVNEDNVDSIASSVQELCALQIIESSNNIEQVNIKYLVYCAIKNRLDGLGEVIIALITNAVNTLNEDGFDNEVGITSCSMGTLLYWASKNKLMHNLYKDIPKIYLDDRISMYEDTYENVLAKLSSKFGGVYYNYKLGIMNEQEFLESLTSENGNLPIYSKEVVVNSPEAYWFGITGEDTEVTLTDSEYSDEIKALISHLIQCHYRLTGNALRMIYAQMIYGGYYYFNRGKFKKDSMSVKNLTKLLEKEKDGKKQYKNMATKHRKDLERLNKANREQEIKIEKLSKELNRLKSSGLTNIEPYKNTIEHKTIEIDNLNNKIREISRLGMKKDITIGDLNSTVKTLKESLDIEKTKVVQALEKVNKFNGQYSSDTINTESIINAIRNKKLVILGGDIIHSNLANLGFKNLTLIKASGAVTSESIIRQADLIIVLTNHVSHQTVEVPKNLAERCGTPLMYFNNLNVNRLVKDIFSFIYSDEYIEAKKRKRKFIKGVI